MYILVFNLKEQLPVLLQNVNEVNRVRPHFRGVFIVRDLTRLNGLVTQDYTFFISKFCFRGCSTTSINLTLTMLTFFSTLAVTI